MNKSARKEGRTVRMGRGNRAVAYTSPIQGVEERETGQPRVYYGIVMRTPRHIAKSALALADMEHTLDEQQAQVEKLAAELEEQRGEVGKIWERFEAFDLTTGDVIVFYRVPVVASDPARNKGFMALRDFNVSGGTFELPPEVVAGLKVLVDRLARATGLPVSLKTVIAAYHGLWTKERVFPGFFDMSPEAEQMVKQMVILFWDDPAAHGLFIDDQAPKQ
jgi:hypothetical protein